MGIMHLQTRIIAINILFAVSFLLTACGGGGSSSLSGTQSTAEQRDIVFIGHSQVNHQMPGYVQWMIDTAGDALTVERQAIGGGNLEENYVLSAQTTDTQDTSLDPSSKQ